MGIPVTLDLCLHLPGLPRWFQPDHIARAMPSQQSHPSARPSCLQLHLHLVYLEPSAEPTGLYCKKATAPRLPRPSPGWFLGTL